MAFGGGMPEKIGRYDVVLQIARGGMATVYLARAEGHGGFDRYVAVKLTAEHLRDDPEFAEHLIEEAKLVAHLRHTNVVPVLDVGEDDMGAVFLVMEYVPGDSLGGLFRIAKKTNGLVPPRVGLRIVVDALAGLHAAHEHTDEDGNSHALVHRDFSPQNILVGTDGIARLTDFGIAKAASRASITMAGTMKGKVSYASPEQARGKPLDRRCDVWAAGVIAWEVVVGSKLYPSTERTLLDIVKGPPPRVGDLLPDIPKEIDDVIARALAMNVEDRIPTAQIFARELAAAARNANMLAEIEEVAEHVKYAVAPILAERKAKIAEARRVRGMQSEPDLEMMEVEPDPSSPSFTPINATMPLPSLPDIPMVTRRIDNAATVPARVAEELMRNSGAPPYDQNQQNAFPKSSGPYPVTTTSGTPPGVARGEGSGSVVAALANAKERPSFSRSSIAQFKQTLVDRTAHFIARRPAIVIGSASAIAVFLLGAAIILVASTGGEKTKVTTTTGASATSAPLPLSTTTPPPPTSLSRISSLGEAEPLPPQLALTADAPITRVRIGKRSVDMEVAAPKIAVELLPEETATSLNVVATAIDGRAVSTTWNPGDTDVSIAFADAPAPAPVPVAKPAGKPPTKPRKPHK